VGYICFWEILQANHYGLPQQRPRAVLVALQAAYAPYFQWPLGVVAPPPTVGQLLYEEMASNGWDSAGAWAEKANGIAPTIVGGSKKHGGADLGPTRARLAWAKLGVDGSGIANAPPTKGFVGDPKLTVKMAAMVQGFSPDWVIVGRKTAAYRQVGNAFPPPVAKAVGGAIMKALVAADSSARTKTQTAEG
jgi:DNA (cytosine-5)-methyltransferase 1